MRNESGYKDAWLNTWHYLSELKKNYNLEKDGKRDPDIYSLNDDQYALLMSIMSKMAIDIIYETADDNDLEEK